MYDLENYEIDFDGDGNADVVLADTDGDVWYDHVFFDWDGDGIADEGLVTADGNTGYDAMTDHGTDTDTSHIDDGSAPDYDHDGTDGSGSLSDTLDHADDDYNEDHHNDLFDFVEHVNDDDPGNGEHNDGPVRFDMGTYHRDYENIDTDGDGRSDTLVYYNDSDSDGVTDVIGYYTDADHDGNYEKIVKFYDFDQDGKAEISNEYFDYDDDGVFDVVSKYYDTTGDGFLDTVHTYYDTDGDGIEDRYDLGRYEDTDGDGEYDTFSYFVDENADGVFEAINIYDYSSSDHTVELVNIVDADDGEDLTYRGPFAQHRFNIENYYPYGDDDGRTIGDPGSAMRYWECQGNTGRCALFAQKFVVEEYLGRHIDTEEFVQIAVENGWFNEDGTEPINMAKMLEYYKIPNEMSFGNDIEVIEKALLNGDRVIVAVDMDEIWYNEQWDGDLMDDSWEDHIHDIFSPLGDGANHAVEVVGIDYSDPDCPMVILNDSGSYDGKGEMVPLDLFIDAWEDSNYQLIVADMP